MTQSPSDGTTHASDPATRPGALHASEVRERYGEAAYVARDGADEEEIAMPEALRQLGLDGEREGVERLLAEQGDFEQLAEFPIIGVLGMLNSGKSSLVQSFLGDEGQGRIPVGIGPSDGTQRFVFWLPEAWRDGEVRQHLEKLIEDNFGAPPELLGEDRAEARRQYNDVNRFTVPMIAFDSGLNQRQVAFLDCPDIQREMVGESVADESGEMAMVSQPRKAVLERAAELCAAFIIVAELKELEKKEVRDFLQAVRNVIPGLPLFTALNQAPAEKSSSDWCAAFADRFAELGLDRVYLAYDFHDGRTPGVLPEDVRAVWDSLKEGERSPLVFFTEKTSPNVPRLLSEMPSTQGPGEWVLRRLRSGWEGFAGRCEKAEQAIEAENREIEDRRKDSVAAVKQSVEEVLIQDGKIRMPVSLSASLLERSIRETAPWYVRPLFSVRKGSEKIGKTTLSSLQSVYRALTGRLLRGGREDMEEKIRNELMRKSGLRVEDLAEALKMRFRSLGVDEATCQLGAQVAFERWSSRFETFGDRVDTERLNEFMEEAWERLSFLGKAEITFLFGVVSALTGLAIFSAAFDGGSTIVLVASGAGALLGGGLAVFSTKQFDQYLQGTLGKRTFSELAAYLLDAFGLPREDLVGEKVRADEIEIGFTGCDGVEPPIANLHLGRSFRRIEGRVRLSEWVRARMGEGEAS